MRNQFTGISGLSEYLIVITTVVETGTYTSIVWRPQLWVWIHMCFHSLGTTTIWLSTVWYLTSNCQR